MEHNEPFIGPESNWIPCGSRELLFGVAALAAGLFFANMVIFGGFRLGFALAAVLSISLSWGYLHRSGCKGSSYSRAVLLLCLIIAAGFGWSADSFVKGWMLLFLVEGVNLGLCLTAGKNRFAPGSARSLFDGLRTLFDLGLGRIGPALRGVAAAFRAGGSFTQRSGAVLTGLAISVPALAVVVPLLISSDAAFEGLVALLPDFDLFEVLTTVILGSLAGLFFFSRAVALRNGKDSARTPKERRGIPPLTMNTALGTICCVYLVYLFSQLAYFVGGFAGILPDGFTAAEYARRGFFEMTLLSAINLGLMTFGVGLVRREVRTPGSTRALCLFLGLVTEFFVAASVAKMALYIGVYGLTRLRVLTMVIMAFLAITTALVCVWLFIPKLQYMKAVLLVGLAIGAAVLWADVDTQVARYNVNAYLSGGLENVDVHYLSELGPGAVEALDTLAHCDDPYYSAWAKRYLANWYLAPPSDFRELSGIWENARQILQTFQDTPATDHP